MPSLLAVLGLDWSGLKSGADKAVAYSGEAGGKIASALGDQVAHHLAGLVSAGMVTELAHKTIEYGEQVSILSQRLGMSTDAIQEWDYALKMNGSSIEANAKTFEKMAISRQKAVDGDGKAIASFRALGVSVEDLKGKRLEDIALQIAEVFQSGDPQKLISDLREVGGKGAGEMVAAFRDGLADLVKEAKDAGVVMSESVVEGLREAGDKSKLVWMEIVAGVAPAVNFLAKMIQGLWRGLQSAATATVGLIVGLMPGSGGPGKVADEMVKELEGKWKEQDDAAAKRAEGRKKPLAGGADEGEDAKAAKAAAKGVAERERLEERLAAMQEKHYLASLTKEQQITELHRRRVELAAWLAANGSKLSEVGRLKAQTDVEELKGEEEAAQRGLDKPKGRHGGGPSVNSLQAIGAFAAGPSVETQALATHQRNEKHLEHIHEGIQKLVERSHHGAGF